MAEQRCYTLLADESSVLANDDRLYRAFRAHIVYTLIVNGTLVLSDNQVISSPNLRRAAHGDGVLRQAMIDKMVVVAMRADVPGWTGPQPLTEVLRAFVAERKLERRPALKDYSSELDFVDRNAQAIAYPYGEVRSAFTQGTRTLLHQMFAPLLTPDEHHRFMALIAAEIDRYDGLGRAFLQNDFLGQATAAGIVLPGDAAELVRQCYDAPYVSNLPRRLGLNPIYAPEHAQSFELLRSTSALEHDDLVAPMRQRARLSGSQFVEGLLELDFRDVCELQNCDARRAFFALQRQTDVSDARFRDMREAFLELNLAIEDRICERRPALAYHSPEGQRRELRQLYATRFERGAKKIVDITKFVLTLGGAPVGALEILFDFVKDQAGDIAGDSILDRITARIADRARRPHNQLAAQLIRREDMARYYQERSDRITVEEIVGVPDMITTDSFAKETIVSR